MYYYEGNLMNCYKKKLSLAICAALLAPSVLAQQTASQGTVDDNVELIEIKGVRLQIIKTIDKKRNTLQIADLVTADDIGKQPDFNVGDALKRITGVSTIPEEDEGQFVSVRGINPDLTWVTFDGAAVASASDGERRRVSLEFFPASLVSGLEVIKARTADMDGNMIGGQVNLLTRSAFDTEGFNAVTTAMIGEFSADGAPVGLDEKSGSNSLTWRADTTISNTFGDDDQFGFVLSASYFAKDRDEERIIPINFESTEGFLDPDSRYAPGLTIWSTYNNPIDRYGTFGKLEYDNDDTIYMSLQGQYFYQEDYARRESEILNGGTPDFAQVNSGNVTGASLRIGSDQFEAENTYTGVQYVLEYTGNDGWEADFRASLSKGEFYQDSPDIDFNSVPVDYAYQYRDGAPYITFADPESALDPNNFSLLSVRPFFQDYDNESNELEGNVSYGYGDLGWGFKAGAKYRTTSQSFTTARDQNDYTGDSATLADFFIDTDYELLFREGVGSLFVNNGEVLAFLQQNPDQFSSTPGIPAEQYGVDEDISALYVSSSYVTDNYELIFGGRYEYTKTDSRAAGEAQSGSYGHFLPSVLLNYDLNEEMKLRLSYAKALGRPNIGDLKISTVEDFGAAVLTVTGGNPDLKARESDNYDLSFEYYFDEGKSILSAALFHKNIENEIFRLSTTGTFNGREAFLSIPQNASDASLSGLELGFIVNELPGIFSNFGLNINYTFIDAETTLLDTDGSETEVDFVFEQPENILNAAIFYTNDVFEAQLALNYSDNFHAGFAGDPGFTDEFDAYKTVDFQARYDLTDNIILIGEVRNITEEPLERRTAPDLRLLNDLSEFGRSFFIGATYKY
jgi:TonB-dependent receptor